MVRRLWKLLSCTTLLVAALLVGASASAGASGSTSLCGGDVSVALDERLAADASAPDSISVTLPVALDGGTYSVFVKTADAYKGRTHDVQLAEQVVLSIDGTTLGPTPDLVDGVESTYAFTTIGTADVAPGTSTLTISHVSPSTGVDDLVVRCVGLTQTAEPPPPDDVDVDVEPWLDCSTDEVKVTLLNNGSAADVSVHVGSTSVEVALGVGGGATTVHDLDEGTHVVVVVAGGETVFDETVTFACDDPIDPPVDPPDDPDDPGDPVDPVDPGDPVDPTDPDDPVDPVDPGDPVDPADPDGGDPNGGDPIGDGTDGTGGAGDGSGSGITDGGPTIISAPEAELATFDPELALRLVCVEQSVEALVSNAGELAGQATLAVARSASSTPLALEAASTTTVTLPLPAAAEGSTAEVVLVTADGDVVSRRIEVDCLQPADPDITVSIDCAARTVEVAIVNNGGEAIAIRAFAEQVALLGTDTLAGGDSARYVAVIDAPSVAVRVTDDTGTDLLRDDIDHGCVETDVAPSLSLLCPAGEVQLTLANAAADDRAVVVSLDGSDRTVLLGAGEEVTLSQRLAAGSAERLAVHSALGDVLLDETLGSWTCESSGTAPECDIGESTDGEWIVVDDSPESCGGISLRLVVDCSSGAATAQIVNDARRPVTVSLARDGDDVGEYTVAAEGSETVVVDDGAGARIVARRVSDDQILVDSRTGCAEPNDRTAAVLGGLLVTLMTIVAGVVAKFDPWLRV